jgi:transposase-like protein
MKGKRFSEEQIISVLREAEAGAKTKELCRRHGISDATFYNWKAKYAGMTVSEADIDTHLVLDPDPIKARARRSGRTWRSERPGPATAANGPLVTFPVTQRN